MNSKLTLKLDKNVIDAVKKYAEKRNISLSKMVEKYFSSLIEKKNNNDDFTSLVKELSGIIHLDKDYDHKEKYGQYLSEKYQ